MLSLHSRAQETTELCTWWRDTPSLTLHHQIIVTENLTWGKCTEIFQDGKWVKIASKVRFLLERQSVCNSWYCLWEIKRLFITIFVLILSASLWFWQQPLLYHMHSLALPLFSFWSIFKISQNQSPVSLLQTLKKLCNCFMPLHKTMILSEQCWVPFLLRLTHSFWDMTSSCLVTSEIMPVLLLSGEAVVVVTWFLPC